jgi:hypothetical protein
MSSSGTCTSLHHRLIVQSLLPHATTAVACSPNSSGPGGCSARAHTGAAAAPPPSPSRALPGAAPPPAAAAAASLWRASRTRLGAKNMRGLAAAASTLPLWPTRLVSAHDCRLNHTMVGCPASLPLTAVMPSPSGDQLILRARARVWVGVGVGACVSPGGASANPSSTSKVRG